MSMKKIIVQAPAIHPGTTPEQIALTAGQASTVGICNCGRCEIDLPIAAEGTPWLGGRITATAGFWMLSNLSDRHPLIVENMDDWYQYIVVDPGRQDMPVPFELAQIMLSLSPSGPKIAVFGNEPRYSTVCRRPTGCRRAQPRRPLLDPDSMYFSVLRELCRSRLDGAVGAVLPTSAEIADRLCSRRRRITPRAVDAHIKYVSDKLRLPKGATREALAAVVIRSGVLQQRH